VVKSHFLQEFLHQVPLHQLSGTRIPVKPHSLSGIVECGTRLSEIIAVILDTAFSSCLEVYS
jgi:hypothetical protein